MAMDLSPTAAYHTNALFRATSLHTSFTKTPLGFIDIGAAGGVHPLISPAASLTHCTCFEPDEQAFHELKKRYDAQNPFAKISIMNTAIGSRSEKTRLYITQSAVNTSLLEPRSELVDRYHVEGFRVRKTIDIETRTLDEVVYGADAQQKHLAEFVKMDCQGAEYDILQGSARLMREQCVALVCELELNPMYKNQKTFSEVDLFVKKEGYQLYGLYPNYISARKMNRRKCDTDERILWADALYFKDPLDSANTNRNFTKRDIEVLILVAMLSRYFDYAMELVEHYYTTDLQEMKRLQDLINALAEERSAILIDDLGRLIEDCRKNADNAYILAKKFIDKHSSNNNIDFIKP